jgi:hypothetical protein
VEFDKVQAKMLFDWTKQSPEMIVEEELLKIELIISNAVDEHYKDDTTLDLITVSHEGKLPIGAEEKGWTVDLQGVWDRIPGDTQEEKIDTLKAWGVPWPEGP